MTRKQSFAFSCGLIYLFFFFFTLTILFIVVVFSVNIYHHHHHHLGSGKKIHSSFAPYMKPCTTALQNFCYSTPITVCFFFFKKQPRNAMTVIFVFRSRSATIHVHYNFPYIIRRHDSTPLSLRNVSRRSFVPVFLVIYHCTSLLRLHCTIRVISKNR